MDVLNNESVTNHFSKLCSDDSHNFDKVTIVLTPPVGYV